MILDRRTFVSVVALTASGALPALSLTRARAVDPRKTSRQSVSIHAQSRYLNLPIKTDAPLRRMTVLVEDRAVRDFDIALADGAADWWAFMDLTAFKGKTLTLEVKDLPAGSSALTFIRQADQIEGHETLYREARRPQFHFSSRRGWRNDPHVVFYDGEYHLFYQHNPYGWRWGNGHWGHAVSTDLVHWQELPIALYPDIGCIMQSGSIVVDGSNTTGFQSGGQKPLVAMFTTRGRIRNEDGRIVAENDIPATQGIAFSHDRGRTWTKYDKNPVIPHLVGGNRDPKVFWYAPENKWVMALYMDTNDFALFASPDLKHWEKLSELSIPGATECPELFEIALDGDPSNTRWVFYVAGGQYLVGRFDGKTFRSESGPHLMQHGNCWYAPQTFSDIPASDGRRILIPWAVNTKEPQQTFSMYEGMPFNGTMGLPVELTLRTTTAGLRLLANPVRELATLRTWRQGVAAQRLSPGKNPLAGLQVDLFELTTEIVPGEATDIVFNLRGVAVRYDAKKSELSCTDRTATLEMEDGKIRLRILVDRTSIDIFGNDGRLYMPMGILMSQEDHSLGLQAIGGNAQISSLELFELKSAWT